jgi:hypothetical protein
MSAAGLENVRATLGIPSGRPTYFEYTITAFTTAAQVGIGTLSASLSNYLGGDANGWGYGGNAGTKSNSGVDTAYGSTWGLNDVLGVAYNGSLWFRKNGVWQNSGDPVAGTGAAFTGITGGTYYPMFGDGTGSAVTIAAILNTGGTPFTYTPPVGFYGLR